MRVVSAQHLDADRARQLIADRLPAAAASALSDLDALLDTDVDDQRTNPLAVLRGHIIEPTSILVDLGAAPVTRDPFDARVAPEDIFALGPATWADVHPDLAEPGLVWGAWKAATVLQRRRAEGQR